MKLGSVYLDNVSIVFAVGTVLFVAFLRFSFKLYQARSRRLKVSRQGLVGYSMEGQMWKTWRGIFNPGFSVSHLMTLTPGIVEETGTFCDTLQTHVQNQTLFRMKDMTDNLTLDVIGRVVP